MPYLQAHEHERLQVSWEFNSRNGATVRHGASFPSSPHIACQTVYTGSSVAESYNMVVIPGVQGCEEGVVQAVDALDLRAKGKREGAGVAQRQEQKHKNHPSSCGYALKYGVLQ